MTALLLIGALAAGQCPGGSCRAPAVVPAVPLTLAPVQIVAPAPKPGASDGWHQFGADEWHLYKGGRQVGGYRPSDDLYLPRNADGTWGEPGEPPVPLPVAARRATAARADDWQTTGVVTSKIGSERHTLTGREVGKTEMMQAIGAASVPDDSRHRRLTIFARDPAERARLLAEGRAVVQAEGLADRVSVTAYSPDSFVARDQGYRVDTPVSVYLTEADGKTIGRESAAWPDRETLAGGLRRIRPDYSPDKDGKIWTVDPFGLGVDPAWLIVAAVGVVALLWYASPTPAKRRK